MTLPEPVAGIVAREAARADVRAVIVAGSWARGDALPGSDLDLYLILPDGAARTFSAGWEDGVLVERTGWDEGEARRRIDANPMSWATFREGVAVRDDGVFGALRLYAEGVAAAWRPDPAEVAACRQWLLSAAVKVRAALASGDEARASWIVGSSLFELARGIFLMEGRPVPAAGAVLREMAGLPRPPPEWEAVLLGATAGERGGAFLAVAERVLSATPPEAP